MTICSYSFEEYVERVRSFHGHPAPGVIIGGFMVDLACRHLPGGVMTDALCETAKCLPDAIQILTPCTIGNGWLKVVNLGRYAVTLYDKDTGEGVRVAVDPIPLEGWPEIRDWFFKFESKNGEDLGILMAEIEEAEGSYLSVRYVKVADTVLHGTKRRAGFTVCARCGEAFPLSDGLLCLGCQGDPLWQASKKKAFP
ncbi:MAG: formylmethanofuran dehydrogenase subunit E family protein [Syntrophobacterales bacterium]|jgi:formylmethanofuran dehydrogenase subunit E|nr:formylmethanofuran dehydrogenase subunit E family protein [Syntrophobacterales bacterium]